MSTDRLENATYTAAEVKVLTETASKVAYALGRKDAGEEIALALEAESRRHSIATAAMVLDAVAAPLAREIGSRAAPDASEPRIDPSMDSDLPPEPQAGDRL